MARQSTPGRAGAVAFLRGMNLGRRRITNDELASVFTALGLGAVAPFLASGNVLFDPGRRTGELESFLERELERALGYPVPTFVRTADEVRTIAARDPFPDVDAAGKPQVILLRRKPSAKARRAIEALATAEDRLDVVAREIHWQPAGPLMESELDLKAIEEAAGATTVRTQRTLARLAAKLPSD